MKNPISKYVILAEEDINSIVWLLEKNAKDRENICRRHFYLKNSKIYDEESEAQWYEDEENYKIKWDEAKELLKTFQEQFSPIKITE